MVFCPSLIGGMRRYSPGEIKEGIKDAYYEIKREEEEERRRKELKDRIKKERENFENGFDLEVGEALVNGDVIGTKLHF